MYKHILVAINLTPRAYNALKEGIKFAHLYKSKITLINVHEEFLNKQEMLMSRVSVEKLQETFWSYSIVTREILTNDDQEAREIFRRINTNVYALNPQELRNATYQGDLMKVARVLQTSWQNFMPVTI